MIYMDVLNGSPLPKRGDRLQITSSLYWVLTVTVVNRRFNKETPRVKMRALKSDDVEPELSAMLLRSASRRGRSRIFDFRWYPRKKKRIQVWQ